MATTLPLFWHLSSSSKKDRVNASVKLISALERFQAEFVPKETAGSTSDEEESIEQRREGGDSLDALNAHDVSYSVRRLVRGLASPRESSRLGFAVALTELLVRIDTVSSSQVVTLIVDTSRTQGSMTRQEEKDVLFARLFGLTAVIQSGLIVRDTLLQSSPSSSTAASDSASFTAVISHLLSLSESKSWLRESAWWGLGLAVDRVGASDVPWRGEALESVVDALYIQNKLWTPEKLALTLKLQKLCPTVDWRKLLAPTLKHPDILASGNLTVIARILKDAGVDDNGDTDLKSNVGSWTPKVHFVWDMLLDEMLSSTDFAGPTRSSFPEFFRILVDESLFAASSSPERKYWGFQIFRKALSRVPAADLPMLFSKNFMRTWINHLSKSDRYLHKAAKQVTDDIQVFVKQNPTLGFTLILQLTGVNGSHQFDKLTKTRTVETILTSVDNDGIQNFITHLLGQVNNEPGSKADDVPAINARRIWIVDQLAALIRNGAVPKNDEWVQSILDWFVVNGFCAVRKASEKSDLLALHAVPLPPFSDDVHSACRNKLLSCLADLTAQTSAIKVDDKAVKVTGAAADGQLWVYKVLVTIEQLLSSGKYVKWLAESDDGEHAQRQSAFQLIRRLHKLSEKDESVKGAELLLSASILHHYCVQSDEDSDIETLQNCIDGASRLFPEKSKKKIAENSDAEPIDMLVDVAIRFLEIGTAFTRTVANQAFTLLSGSLQSSTIDLIVAQLVSRDPAELAAADDDMEAGDALEDSNEEGSASDDSEEDDENDDGDEEAAGDSQLREAIEEALRVNGIETTLDSSDGDSEELMNDDQMMAIDEQLAAVFKARADEKGRVGVQREATHYKNRVLDLVDAYLKRHASSVHATYFITPLVELLTGSLDEKQLADKATGILRSRLGKSKETPSITDTQAAVSTLQELHVRARTAPSSDVLTTLSQCNLYLCRGLLQVDAQQAIVEAYRESIVDFMTRKASRLNSPFFQDFIRRYPAVAWDLRNDLVEISGKAVNGYRKAQAFQLLQTVINHLSTVHDANSDTIAFMATLSHSINDTVGAACEDSSLTPPQVKEILKLAQSAVRQTKRIAAEDVSAIWNPTRWQNLAQQLANTDSFKLSTGLQNICKQIAQAANPNATTIKPAQDNMSSKRKAETQGEDTAVKSAKRKKTKARA